MSIIRTVCGDIAPEALGHTQCHEHIFIEKDKSAEISPVLLIDDFDKSKAELDAYKKAGGGSIVDAQPVMSGRMASWERQVSQKSGVNIIASTGFHKTLFYYDDSYIFDKNEDYISELYISEIKQGMLDSKSNNYKRTDIKAGIIKVAVDGGGLRQSSTYEKLHSAAANAQLETGAAVMCHVESGADAAQLADFYLQRGVSAERLWLAHMDRACPDFGMHEDVLSKGCYLEYDTIAREKYHSNEKERSIILRLLELGYEDRLLISLDTTRARLLSYGGEFGLCYILKSYLPYLAEAGITKEQIRRITLENPANALQIKI